jgi:hypothetical protein
MGVDRLKSDRYSSDKDYAQRSTREKLKFILANKKHLSKVRRGTEMYLAADSMSRQQEPFTPGQMRYVEGIYEKVMDGAGYDICDTKHDNKRGLRY